MKRKNIVVSWKRKSRPVKTSNTPSQENPEEGGSKPPTKTSGAVDAGVIKMAVASVRVRGIDGWHGVALVHFALCIDLHELCFLDYVYIIK